LPATHGQADPPTGPQPSTSRGWRVLVWGAGVGLIVGAVWTAAKHIDFEAISRASPLLLAGLAAGIVANLLLTAALHWQVTRVYDTQPPVGFRLMLRLTAASALLNYLPLQPALLGRAAYLKLRHGLPLRQSVWITIVILAVGLTAMLAVSAAALLWDGDVGKWRGVTVLIVAAVAAPLMLKALLRRPAPDNWTWTPLRMFDVAVTACRLWLAFRIIGQPVSPSFAVLCAAASALVAMLPLSPNGLGLSEWAVAAIAEMTAVIEGPVGLAAKLVDRAIEALVIVLCGAPAIGLLRKPPA